MSLLTEVLTQLEISPNFPHYLKNSSNISVEMASEILAQLQIAIAIETETPEIVLPEIPWDHLEVSPEILEMLPEIYFEVLAQLETLKVL